MDLVLSSSAKGKNDNRFLVGFRKHFKSNNLHSDWLSAVQFFFKQCRKELIQCKKRTQSKHSDWSMIKETQRFTDGQSNLLFSNQVHTLDGAIDGKIFP